MKHKTEQGIFWGENPGLYNANRHRRRFMPVKKGRKRTCASHGNKKPCEACYQEALAALSECHG